MLFDKSEEGELEGLKLIPGEVKRFNSFDKDFKENSHMTWNYVSKIDDDKTYKVLMKIQNFTLFIHIMQFCSDEYVSGYSEYGGADFPVLERAIFMELNFIRKSHTYGMKFLKISSLMRPRIIPVLLVEDGGLVKTIKFNKRVYLGDPINTVRLFNDMEVDELVVLDISATKMQEVKTYRLSGI